MRVSFSGVLWAEVPLELGDEERVWNAFRKLKWKRVATLGQSDLGELFLSFLRYPPSNEYVHLLQERSQRGSKCWGKKRRIIGRIEGEKSG